MSPPLIHVEGVTVRAGAATLLTDISLQLRAGAPTIIVGPNGSGKTTLLRVMMGLIAPAAGHVAVNAGPCGFVFQKPVMLRRSAAANVAFALQAAYGAADAASVAALLELVGLQALGDRPARKLSGGEQQRLALARALAKSPEILFLDEPTASLDPAQTKAVEEIIASVAARGVKIVMATHDLGEARRLGGEIVFLVKGRVAEQSPVARFFSHPVSDVARRFIAGELII